MILWEQIRTGFSGLLLHKLRSALTMLGIIFGVAAVVSMVAIGEGAKEEALRQIEAFGARTLYVKAVDLAGEKRAAATRQGSVGLCLSDRDYLIDVCPFLLRGAPQILIDAVVVSAGQQPNAQVVGVDEAYAAITGNRPFRGRFITADDVKYQRNVCVLGWEAFRQLFVDRPAVGGDVTISGHRYHVVGVMPCTATSARVSKGSAAGAQVKTRDVDRDVYIPLSAALEQFQGYRWKVSAGKDPKYHRVRELILEVKEMNQVAQAKSAVADILRKRHGDVEDVEVVAPLELLEQSRKAQNLFNLVLACIAGLSLLVGGIGIMNIMLANVSERTKEIGIRRSVGATQQDILVQFLIEALCISLLGGLLGIGLGMGIAIGAGSFLGWKAKFTLWATLLAFVVASGVGIVFGMLPARVAAQMDPVQALRYE